VLGVPEDSLQSFPEAFRAGMAARAGRLLDYGENDPEHWDAPFGSGLIHIGVSVFSDSEPAWRRTMEMARRQYEGFPGLTVLMAQDFGAQPGDLNPLGYKDSIGQPAIEGSGVDPLPGQGPPVKAGEFILGYPGEAGVPLPMPQPDVLGRNGTYAGLHNGCRHNAKNKLTTNYLYLAEKHDVDQARRLKPKPRKRGIRMASEHVVEVLVRRHVFDSERPFASVLDDVFGGISQPDIGLLFSKLAASTSYEQFSSLVAQAQGSAGLILFLQLDLDHALTLDPQAQDRARRRLVRLIAGNPVTMGEMTRHVADAGSFRCGVSVKHQPLWMAAMRALSESRVGYAPCAGTPGVPRV
jgi:hypothetical protein